MFIQSAIELAIIAIAFVGLLNEDKLIRWEDKIIRGVKNGLTKNFK